MPFLLYPRSSESAGRSGAGASDSQDRLPALLSVPGTDHRGLTSPRGQKKVHSLTIGKKTYLKNKIKACLVLSSQILLTEEFVEKMLEDLEDLTSPEEVSLLDSV